MNAASVAVEPVVAAAVVVVDIVAVVADDDRVVEFATSGPVEHPAMITPIARAAVMG